MKSMLENKKHVCGFALYFLLLMLLVTGCKKEEATDTLRIAIPHSYHIQKLESNYYIKWLEQQCKLQIIPIEITQTRCNEYLKALKESDVEVDIVFFGEEFVPEKELLQELKEEGVIEVFEDGSSYYNNYGAQKTSGCGQVMWMNAEFLSRLGLSVPETTEELKQVLRAFASQDPNKNGRRDEIPLIGSVDAYAFNPIEYLLNSFVYNDPYHMRFYRSNQSDYFAPEDDRFREGLDYCKELYQEQLLDERTFFYSVQQLREVLNQPDSIVGAFCTDSIGSLIYQGNPEIVAKYICVPPLSGPKGEKNALYVEKEPEPAAVVLARSQEKENALRLLDVMMTKEASLIARFGEEGVDWEYSDGQDVSIYGGRALLITKNYIWNIPQNKHLNGIGPMRVPSEYLEGVTWNGLNSDIEYIDARAKLNYISYVPQETSEHTYDEKIADKLNEMILAWVKGERQNEEIPSWDRLSHASASNRASNGMCEGGK